jgi:hypothetical protein
MKFRRLFPFLILNIILSSVTTLAILFYWDRTRPIDFQLGATLLPEPSPVPEITVTLPPLDKPVVQIKSVIGVGDIKNELVLITRLGENDLELNGWVLKDENGHSFKFPKLLLNKDGAVQVYSGAGADSVIELHWSLTAPIWQSGEQALLFDPQGNLRASFRIP